MFAFMEARIDNVHSTRGELEGIHPTTFLRASLAGGAQPATRPKLLDQVRDAIRTRHYSYRTEEAYVGWIKRFILLHHKRHPAEMGKAEIEDLLTAWPSSGTWQPRHRTRH